MFAATALLYSSSRFSDAPESAGEYKYLCEHVIKCDSFIDYEYIGIIATTIQGEHTLLTLEAFQIKDLKPSINSKDDFRSRAFKIRIRLDSQLQCPLFINIQDYVN